MSKSLYHCIVVPTLAICLGFARLTFGQDTNAPYLTAVQPPREARLYQLDQITVTFNEPVVGLYAEDLLVNGNPALSVSNFGNSYSFTVAAPMPGEVRISFNASHGIMDAAGNLFDPSAPGHSWTYSLVDEEPPVLTVVLPVPGASVTRLETVQVLFSEPVAGVTAEDLLINGVPATTVTGLGLGPYQFTFAPPAAGVVQLSWAEGQAIFDLAEPPNRFAGGSWSNTLVSPGTLGRVIINEFLANNVKTLTNEFGATEDWIELFNPGSNAVGLLGWSLTDDKNYPALWTFPDISLGAGKYLVVFADGLNVKTLGASHYLHTNFKLNDQGDYLALCNADFPPTVICAFEPGFPEQRPDYSYGLSTNGTWNYYLIPTPGRPNGDSIISGVTPVPHLNADGGIYDQAFTLIASCPLPEAALRFTTDGSLPTEANGQPYTGPLVISNTTVFRLAAFATNRLPSRVMTHSFLFIDQILRQPKAPPGYPAGTNVWSGFPSDYEMDTEIVTNNPTAVQGSLLSLPTLAIAIKIDDLFGSTNGIYTHPEPPDAQRYLWERPCSVELFLTNGQTGFQVDCGIRIQGNASRTPLKTPKHSFRLYFKGAYGPGRLDYPVFPESPVQSFNSLVLHADYNNSWLHYDPNQRLHESKVRDAWAKDTFRAMNGISGHSRPFHLYLNGLYWGVYAFGERIDADFAASYLGGTAEEWDAIVSKPTEAADGDMNAYNTMVNIGRRYDMTQSSNYLFLQQSLDLPIFLDYMLLNFYGANLDWGYDGNWNAIHRRAPGQTFKYVPWDAEQFCVSTTDNRVSSSDLPSGLHTNLVNSPQYRMDFADRVRQYCFNNGLLTPGPAADRWMEIAHTVESGMLSESARWGDYRRDVARYANPPYYLYTTNAHWWPEMRRMQTNYFPSRTTIFIGQLRAAGLYPNIAAPEFTPPGGRTPAGSTVTISASNTIYYTLNGIDPRVAFTGEITPCALTYSNAVVVTSSLRLKARAYDGTNWSALSEAFFQIPSLDCPLVLTEIMYNPIGGEAYEFLELHNFGMEPLDVSGWTFQGVSFTFSAGTVLFPGQTIVLANNIDPAAFATRYPGVHVFGYYSYKLDNDGERLALLDRTGVIRLAVDYHNSGGWPTLANGQGYSLELNDPRGDPDAASNWRAASYNGTPGIVIPGEPPGDTSIEEGPFDVRLTEIMAANFSAVSNAGTFPDWIELYNRSSSTAGLFNWSLTDDSNERKYVFPSNTFIPPQGYLVVWCDSNFLLPGLHTGFNLHQEGETVSLYNASTTCVDRLTYGLQLPNYSLGRAGREWVLALPTPGSNNAAAALASPTNLCLNEWLANSPPGGKDWLELFNPAPQPVALTGLYLTQSNKAHQLRSLSFMAPGGHCLLWADGQAGVNHLNFKLPAGGGAIGLYDAASNPLDAVSFGAQAENISEGRYPDGSANIIEFVLSPSPGASNYLPNLPGPLLNEVMALNHGVMSNAAGHAADWVEIYNPLGSSLDLTGYRLSTSYANPEQWVFPPGVVLPANGFRVVWFDKARAASVTNELQLNTGRALNGDGDAINLFNAAGLLMDAVKFGPQAADYTIGRVEGAWALLAAPTPGSANTGAAALDDPANLRFNEWLAAPWYGQDPFFELYNLSAQPVQLSGLYLTGELSLPGLTQFQIGALSYAGPHGFVKFKADTDLSKGPNHVNFMLDANGGGLRLSSPNLDLLDVVYFGLQTQGASQGCLPDGSANITSFACPTPGDSNALALNIFIMAQPLSQTVYAGSTVTLSVEAIGGDLLTYQWYFANAPISGATSPTLTLYNVQARQAGNYQANIANACVYVTSAAATLTVLPAVPIITTQPASCTNNLGDTVAFSVSAASSSPLSYQWRFNNLDLPFGTNLFLLLPNVGFTNAGAYTVLVRNLAGSVTSEPAWLSVFGPFRIMNPQLINSSALQFSIHGPLYRNYTLQGSSTLHNWTELSSFTLTNLAQIFTQPKTTNSPVGYYRLRLGQ